MHQGDTENSRIDALSGQEGRMFHQEDNVKTELGIMWTAHTVGGNRMSSYCNRILALAFYILLKHMYEMQYPTKTPRHCNAA